MRVPLSWLTEYVEIDRPLEQWIERLTLAGLEVTGVEFIGGQAARRRFGAGAGAHFPETGRPATGWEQVFVGQITEIKPHPSADRLVLAMVDWGHGPRTAITGAPNLKVGDRGLKVPVAELGAELINPYEEGTLKVKPARLRGVASEAVICSEKELGLSQDHSGVLILDDDAPMGAPLAELLADVVIEIEILPNIARCLSVVGLAREVAALTTGRLTLPRPRPLDGPEAIPITIQDPQGCPRYAAAGASQARIGPSPFWLRRRLLLSGMRPINNIVDITNYVMLEWGEPLHAFDRQKLRGEAIIVRRARPRETLTTLDGQARRLRQTDLLICTPAGPVALAGLMGGEESEIGPETTEILFEAASFDPISVRRTAAEHGIPSESGYRFARGVDPELPPLALARAVELTQRLAGAKPSGYSDAYPRPWRPQTYRLRLADVHRLLGLDLSLQQVREALERLDFRVTAQDQTLEATPPSYRLDLEGWADLVEEVARVVGYQNIPQTLMADVIPPHPPNPDWEAQETVRQVLTGAGLTEVLTYSLTSPEHLARLDPEGSQPDTGRYLRVANPISRDRLILRQELLAGIVEPLGTNLRLAKGAALFEIGRTYHTDEDGRPRERLRLALALAGPAAHPSWVEPQPQPAGFYHLKGVVEALLERLGVEEAEFRPGEHRSLHPARRATLYVRGEHAGDLGQLHPRVRANLDLEAEQVSVAELHLDRLLAARRMPQFEDILRFPSVVEDLALIVDRAIPAAEVRRVLEAEGQPLLRSVRLFDVYQGDPVPPGKVSLAFSLTYQAPDRTLTDREVERIRSRLVARAKEELGARLR